MPFSREKSIVRFETQVNYINKDISSQIERTSTTSLGTRTRKSSTSLSLRTNQHRTLHQTHQYVPRLHRQPTEVPGATPLGCALKQFTQTCLRDELSLTDKSSALDEFRLILNNATKAISRNLMGLQFQPPVYGQGHSHWQSQPEKRVVCYLPVRLPKIETYPVASDKVLLQLPRRFPANMNIEPKDLEGFRFERYIFTSSKKMYSLVMRILKRALLLKSVNPENINFSPSENVMEITLQENSGWIGEIVLCVVPGNSDSTMYSCRPFNEQKTERPDIIDGADQSHSLETLETDEVHSHSHHTTEQSIRRFSQSTFASVLLPVAYENDNEDVSTVGDSYYYTLHDSVLEERGGGLTSSRGGSNSNSRKGNNSRAEANVQLVSRNSQTLRSKSDKSEEDAMTMTDSTTIMENLTDIHWYPCSPQSENNVFETISRTDGGMRMTAMMIVCKLAQHDWRLLSLKCYDVQTAMLHDVEHKLDHTPRWQRDTLEHCVRSILSKLHTFIKINKGLPHFCVNGVNLWSQWDRKQLELTGSALGRLASTDTSLVSLVCRAGGISVEDLT